MEQYLVVCSNNVMLRVVVQVDWMLQFQTKMELFGVVFLIHVLPQPKVAEFGCMI
jgi:hypothetical protein